MRSDAGSEIITDEGEMRRLVIAAGEYGEVDRHVIKRSAKRISSVIRLETVTDIGDIEQSQSSILHIISYRGLASWSKNRLPTGSVVHIREYSDATPKPWLRVCVRHCTVGIRGFLIGAAFEFGADDYAGETDGPTAQRVRDPSTVRLPAVQA